MIPTFLLLLLRSPSPASRPPLSRLPLFFYLLRILSHLPLLTFFLLSLIFLFFFSLYSSFCTTVLLFFYLSPCPLFNTPLSLRFPCPTPLFPILFPLFLIFALVFYFFLHLFLRMPLHLFLLHLIPLLLLPLILVLLFSYSSLPPVPHPAPLFYTLCSYSSSAPSTFSLYSSSFSSSVPTQLTPESFLLIFLIILLIVFPALLFLFCFISKAQN